MADDQSSSSMSTAASDCDGAAAAAVEKDYFACGISEAASSFRHAAAKDDDDDDDEDDELDLGLFLAAGGTRPRVESFRILTAKDLPPSFSSQPSSSQAVVGWPPVRTFRMNKFFDQYGGGAGDERVPAKGKGFRFVKVNMDGDRIGRKVDIGAHRSYESLALALEAMFSGEDGAKALKILGHESSDLVLTYEDKEGDWMLAGDVPWGMFLASVKRLRIMRVSDASGIASRSLPSNARR